MSLPERYAFFSFCSFANSFSTFFFFFVLASPVSFFSGLYHHKPVCFLRNISYHCSSLCSTLPLCFRPRLSLCLRPFVLWPPGSERRLSAFPCSTLLCGSLPLPRPMHREPAGLIKQKQTLGFPLAFHKTLLIEE